MSEHELMFKPKLWTTLKNYSWKQFRSDSIAGMIVGVVALPLAIAFAIASGVSPDRGLVTAVVAGFLISVLGGSKVQIGGPTGAFVVIVYSIVQKFGIDGLIVATLMAGVILVIMGFSGFGGVIKFIPYPVTVGFTSGIAFIIFSSQIKDLLGLQMGDVPAEFFSKWQAYGGHFQSMNGYAIFLSLATIATIYFWKRVTVKIPGSLIALIVATVATQWLNLPVETIGSRFGHIPNTLPMPVFPNLSWEMIRALIPSATTIAILAGIESLLSAVVADGMIGGKHRSNMELIAQGVANMASALFGGMPATGAIARTATNVHNGGRTPVAGVVHALTLLMLMLFFAKWAVHIPLACLAGILVVVSYHMSEWRSFLLVLKSPRSDIAVLLTTFALTVMVDLTVAIETGMILAAFLFIRRLSMVSNISVFTQEFTDEEESDDPNALNKRLIPQGVEVYEINGPFFFAVTSTFLETIKVVEKKPKIRILRMRHVMSIDASGLNALRQVHKQCERERIPLILSGVHAQPLMALEKSGLYDQIGEGNIFGNIDDALNRSREILGVEKIPRPLPFVPTVKREMD